jgi:hypothetical protein
MNTNAEIVERVIGFDAHPDTFTAALLRRATPATAIIEKNFNRVTMAQLPSWAKKHTTDKDLVILEASGNSFQVVRTLQAIGRKALVLESRQLGQLKEAHANKEHLKVRIAEQMRARKRNKRTVPVPEETKEEVV